MSEFVPFQKIGRLSREIIITEKIDGTNGVIAIGEDGSFEIGSRNRWIIHDQDSFGFLNWALMHKDELMQLRRRPALRRMVGCRHPAALRPKGKAVLAVQCQPLGRRRDAPGMLRCGADALPR